jgi:hypothetical protein
LFVLVIIVIFHVFDAVSIKSGEPHREADEGAGPASFHFDDGILTDEFTGSGRKENEMVSF